MCVHVLCVCTAAVRHKSTIECNKDKKLHDKHISTMRKLRFKCVYVCVDNGSSTDVLFVAEWLKANNYLSHHLYSSVLLLLIFFSCSPPLICEQLLCIYHVIVRGKFYIQNDTEISTRATFFLLLRSQNETNWLIEVWCGINSISAVTSATAAAAACCHHLQFAIGNLSLHKSQYLLNITIIFNNALPLRISYVI